MRTHFILYVADQKRSASFYASALGLSPTLDVPGMTEFRLGVDSILGLMPEAGVVRLFQGRFEYPSSAPRIPRAELYLIVDDAAACHARAVGAGAKEISPMADRDWDHRAAYSLDPDGHVLAFAEEIDQSV